MLGDVKSQQSYSRVKSRSRAPGHNVCLRSMSRIITMQDLTLAAIFASEKRALFFVLSFKMLGKYFNKPHFKISFLIFL